MTNERSAKLFKNGKNQAVRLPKEFEFEGVDEVMISKDGDSIILTPIRPTWVSLVEEPVADDDFMSDRPELFSAERVKF